MCKQLSLADIHCFILPILQRYLTSDIVEVTEVSLLLTLLPPVLSTPICGYLMFFAGEQGRFWYGNKLNGERKDWLGIEPGSSNWCGRPHFRVPRSLCRDGRVNYHRNQQPAELNRVVLLYGGLWWYFILLTPNYLRSHSLAPEKSTKHDTRQESKNFEDWITEKRQFRRRRSTGCCNYSFLGGLGQSRNI